MQGYIEELEQHLIPILGDKIEDLKQKYTQIKNIPAKKSKLMTPKLLDSSNHSIVESDLDLEKLETWARYGAKNSSYLVK